MHLRGRLLLLFVWGLGGAAPLRAQMPFYTDDASVTEAGTLHFELFNEYDALQSSQYPNVHQNTVNYKMNFGLPHRLEVDIDSPYLAILRTDGATGSNGPGDTEMGIKWAFHQAAHALRAPGLAATYYVEVPTGNVREQLGSGRTDNWLNFIAQEPLSDRTRATVNAGFLFTGNTSTGVIGTQNTHGQVYTNGLSLVHDCTKRLTLGAEAYSAIADRSGLGKDQLQGLAGGIYEVRDGLSVTIAVLGGAHEASPRIGAQVGFEVDFPAVVRKTARTEP